MNVWDLLRRRILLKVSSGNHPLWRSAFIPTYTEKCKNRKEKKTCEARAFHEINIVMKLILSVLPKWRIFFMLCLNNYLTAKPQNILQNSWKFKCILTVYAIFYQDFHELHNAQKWNLILMQ